jgi:hypothetical protein
MTRTARLGLASAAGLAVLALVLITAAGTARWVTAVPADPELPGSARVALKGSALVPAAVPLALMGVAGLLAAAASGRMARGLLRAVASVLVVAAGAGVAWLALRAVIDPGAVFRHLDGPRQASAILPAERSPIGWAAVAGGLALLVAGGVALVTGRGWPGLAARYERDPAAPAARPAAPTSTWDALERGEDPTR